MIYELRFDALFALGGNPATKWGRACTPFELLGKGLVQRNVTLRHKGIEKAICNWMLTGPSGIGGTQDPQEIHPEQCFKKTLRQFYW